MEDEGYTYEATIRTHRDGAYAVNDAKCGMIVFLNPVGSGNVSFGKGDMTTEELMLLLAQTEIMKQRILRLLDVIKMSFGPAEDGVDDGR